MTNRTKCILLVSVMPAHLRVGWLGTKTVVQCHVAVLYLDEEGVGVVAAPPPPPHTQRCSDTHEPTMAITHTGVPENEHQDGLAGNIGRKHTRIKGCRMLFTGNSEWKRRDVALELEAKNGPLLCDVMEGPVAIYLSLRHGRRAHAHMKLRYFIQLIHDGMPVT
jgi:hypothetical protein